jgi:hypothetical protein
LALIAVLLLAAVDRDIPPPRLFVGLDVGGGARVQADASAVFSGALELGFAPASFLRLQLSGGGAWEGTSAAGSRGAYRLLGGADVLLQKWWGDLFVGLAGGALTNTATWLPLGEARFGLDITLALPIYLGLQLSYGLAVPGSGPLWHFAELGGRIGLAW